MNPYEVLIRPILSEKSNATRESQGKYTFLVQLKATKDDVKSALHKLYGVKVDTVRTLVTRGRIRQRGQHVIAATKEKKAVVTLAKGQKLPLFEEQ